MKHVWVAAAVAPLAFAASLAHAQTTVSTASTTPLVTSTAGNVTIGANGSITLPAASVAPLAAVTLNSNNTVTNNGTISSTGPSTTTVSPTASPAAFVAGIQALGGSTGEIVNTGNISITETDTSTDANKDGVIDTENGVLGAYASGSNRYGILISGPGTFTGVPDATNNTANPTGPTALYSSGTITVVGENSAGIAVLTSVTGDIIVNGTISVTGGNLNPTTGLANGDTSYDILTTAQVNGAIKLAGAFSSTGGNAVGVAIQDGATGGITFSGSATTTGYRDTSPRTSFGVATIALIEQTPAEVMQGGPALWVAGNVGGGLNITAAVAATSTVAAVGVGTVTSYGDAPALLIGNGTNATTLSAVSGDTHGLVIGGAVTGQGVYDNVNAIGAQIGGSYGGVAALPVNITGGLSVTGTISASAYGNYLGPSRPPMATAAPSAWTSAPARRCRTSTSPARWRRPR